MTEAPGRPFRASLRASGTTIGPRSAAGGLRGFFLLDELTCLYTSTATEDFILDRQGPFVICSACSGHGAKFAPLTGEIAADLACGGTTPDRRFTLAAHSA